MEKVWGFFKEMFKLKYLIAVVVVAAIIFCVVRVAYIASDVKEIKQAQKVTDVSINKVQELVASQDKVVERIYSTTVREVQKNNVDIQKHVQGLSSDAVVIELNTLLDQYRGERRGD